MLLYTLIIAGSFYGADVFPVRWDFKFFTFLMANSYFGINDREGSNGAGFSPSTSAFPCEYYSAIVPYMVVFRE